MRRQLRQLLQQLHRLLHHLRLVPVDLNIREKVLSILVLLGEQMKKLHIQMKVHVRHPVSVCAHFIFPYALRNIDL